MFSLTGTSQRTELHMVLTFSGRALAVNVAYVNMYIDISLFHVRSLIEFKNIFYL